MMFKRPSSKAAASEEARRKVFSYPRPPIDCGNSRFPRPYVEPLIDARTKLAAIFNILIEDKPTTEESIMRVAVKKSRAAKARPTGSGSGAENPIELPDGMLELIRTKAHKLWEARGRGEGNALQDWLDAEEIVMEEIHEARE
jgi:hypothetical protein